MQKMLIVDDEPGIREIIAKYARFEGYQVVEACDGLSAVQLCQQNHFDLIILDITMPVMDGFQACAKIREITNTPVLMLTARGEEYDRIRGFSVGADDYVVKPFSPRELMMRAGAILRRVRSPVEAPADMPEHDIIEIDGLTIDFSGHQALLDGKPLALTPKELELLMHLVRNRRVAQTRENIINVVWGYDFPGDDRTLDTHMKLLRRKLGRMGSRIVTLRGLGYRFEG